MPKLIVKFESAVIKEFPVMSSTVTVGRKPDNDLVIDHPAVSGHHCKIMLQGDIYFVEDLNSTNGTMVNDKKIIKAGLHNQDKIAIAKHTIVFMDDRPVSAEAIAQMSQVDPAPVQAAPVPTPAPAAKTPAPAPAAQAAAAVKFDKKGGLRVTDGIVDKVEYELTENSTYIGKSERVAIKIKGMLAPEVAAMVSRKPEGFFLVAIKDDYPKVNGMPVKGQRLLNEGDVIEVGGTTLQFYLKSSS